MRNRHASDLNAFLLCGHRVLFLDECVEINMSEDIQRCVCLAIYYENKSNKNERIIVPIR